VKFTAEESNPLWSNGSVWHRREAWTHEEK
jgi:hypothetical protein